MVQKDEIIHVFADWIRQHRRPREALLPQNMGQNLIDILVADTEDMIEQAASQSPKASQYITAATLLLLGQIRNNSKIQITKSELSQAISRMTHAVHLENLRRRGIIKNLEPEFSLDNIFHEETRYHYELTELGKQVTRESRGPLPSIH